MRVAMLASSVPLLAVFFASSCSGYRIERPTTPYGMACAEACDGTRNTCVALAESLADSDRQTCEASKNAEMERCQRYAADDRTRQACEASIGSCGVSAANTGKCSDDHAMCVLRCGGREVEK